MEKKRETRRMLIAACTASLVFLLLFLGLRWHLLVCLLLCVGVYIGLYLLGKPSWKIAGIQVADTPENEELRTLLRDAQEDLDTMSRARRSIADPAVQQDAEALCDTGKRILVYLAAHPEKSKLARRFCTYYLDTAAKLLERYVHFQKTDLHTQEVTAVLTRTAQALPVLAEAFSAQFTRLMEGELMDVEADIALLEQTLKWEEHEA